MVCGALAGSAGLPRFELNANAIFGFSFGASSFFVEPPGVLIRSLTNDAAESALFNPGSSLFAPTVLLRSGPLSGTSPALIFSFGFDCCPTFVFSPSFSSLASWIVLNTFSCFGGSAFPVDAWLWLAAARSTRLLWLACS